MAEVFCEERLSVRVVAGADPDPVAVRRHAGVSARVGGTASHRWYPLVPGDPGADTALVARTVAAGDAGAARAVRGTVEALAAAVDEPGGEEAASEARRAAERVHRAAGSMGLRQVKVAVRWVRQAVATWLDGRPGSDHRGYFTVGVRAYDPASGAWVDRDVGSNTAPDLGTAAERLEEQLADVVPRLRAGRVPPPAGAALVLAGGDTGVFFHELVGHPLEADVVLAGGSYLGGAGGCASSGLLTIVDDPGSPDALVRMAIDDEGSVAEPVVLVGSGRPRGLLNDLDTARALGRPPNGHGRRLDYAHAPVPRQSHLAVRPVEAGADPVRTTRRGILVAVMRPRHVDVGTGWFSFIVDESREIAGGQVGPQLVPFLIEGHATAALEAVDAVGGVAVASGGRGGCGKLEQGPLPGSFSHPPVRIAAGAVWWDA